MILKPNFPKLVVQLFFVILLYSAICSCSDRETPRSRFVGSEIEGDDLILRDILAAKGYPIAYIFGFETSGYQEVPGGDIEVMVRCIVPSSEWESYTKELQLGTVTKRIAPDSVSRLVTVGDFEELVVYFKVPPVVFSKRQKLFAYGGELSNNLLSRAEMGFLFERIDGKPPGGVYGVDICL